MKISYQSLFKFDCRIYFWCFGNWVRKEDKDQLLKKQSWEFIFLHILIWNQVDINKVVETFLVFLHTINILWITQVYCVMVASLWIRIAGLHFSQVCPFQTNHVERTGKGTRSSRKPRPWRDVIEKKVVNSQAGHKNVMQYLYVSMSFCRAKNKI